MSIVVLVSFAVSTGRRFGAPVPVLEDRLRREPVEYIVAIANLFRRSGRRKETLQHYRNRLRRRLSERYAIDPSLPDMDFARQLANRDSALDVRALTSLLRQLDMPKPAESDLLRLSVEVEKWLKQI
jgi:hypothetical protein